MKTLTKEETEATVTAKLALIGSEMLPGAAVECHRKAADAELAQWFFVADKRTGAKRYYIIVECDAPKHIGERDFDEYDATAYGWQPQRYMRREITAPKTPNA